MASSVFLLILSEGSSPKGSSSSDLRSGFRHLSKMVRNAPLLARSPRKPSSSFSSILKLSTSTDGRRLAPCRAMPVVVMISAPIFPLSPPHLSGPTQPQHTFFCHRPPHHL